MAAVNNGTKVSIPANQLPTGYTKPTVTEFSDQEYTNQGSIRTFTIAKAGVENADDAVTFAAIVAAVTAAVTVLLEADFDDAAKTVDAWSDMTAITTNANLDGVLYTDGAVNYLCTVIMYVKTS